MRLTGSAIFAILMFLSVPAPAQEAGQGNRNSLRSVLSVMKEDTLKIPVLIQAGREYEANLPDTAKAYYNEAKRLSLSLGYDAGFIEYVKNYTAVLNVQGEFDSSLLLSTQGFELAKRHGWETEIVKSLTNLAVVYQYKENYQQSLDYYLQALALAEKPAMRLFLPLLYSNVTTLYRNLDEPQKAEQYARKAVALAVEAKDEFNLSMALINLANVLKDKGEVGEGMALLNRAYQLGRKRDDLNVQETALINLGDGYLKLGQPDRSRVAFSSALPLADSLGDVTGTGIILQGFALASFRMKLWTEAEHAGVKALKYSREHDLKKIEADVLLVSSDVQIALGNLVLSDNIRNQYDSVRNLLLDEEKIKNIQELETKYALEKNKRELVQKSLLLEEGERVTERQRFELIGAATGIVALSGILVFAFYFYRQKKNLNEVALNNLRSEHENLRLRSVLEGETQERRRISQEMHDDMGSGLTSLIFQSRAIPDGRGKEIGEGAQLLVQKMSEIIWSMNDEQDTLDSLIAYVRKNAGLALEAAGISYGFDMPEMVQDLPLDQDFRRNVYLAVKEAIHNVVRHASATQVNVSIETGSNLIIKIGDNGKGMEPGNANRFGNGIKNMRRRILSVGGDLQISSGPGTIVKMEIP